MGSEVYRNWLTVQEQKLREVRALLRALEALQTTTIQVAKQAIEDRLKTICPEPEKYS